MDLDWEVTPIFFKQMLDLLHILPGNVPGTGFATNTRRKLTAQVPLAPRAFAAGIPAGTPHFNERAF